VAVLLLGSEPAPPGGGGGATVPPAQTSPPSLEGGRIPTPTEPGFPSPPPGAVVFAREAGTRALGLAIVPATSSSLVRVSVLSSLGPGATGLDVALVAGGNTTRLPACGAGCYQADVPTVRLRGEVVVRLDARGYSFTLPPSLRLPSGTATVKHASAVWRSLETLVWHERLASSPTDALHTVYKAKAPSGLSYTIEGHSSSVIIGRVRWDRATPHGRWVRSEQNPPIRQPVPFWSTVSDARILGSETVAGHRVWDVSFFDPTTPAWFRARIDKATGHTLLLDMTAVAHFMHHVYGPFNAPIRLLPPTA
jgi:hypothetical protein